MAKGTKAFRNDKTNMLATKVKASLRYYGAKWKMAPWIISHFPPHVCYVEPFGGSGAVLMSKTPSTVEVYNDLDRAVVTFFRVLRNQPHELIKSLELTPYAREELESANEALPKGTELKGIDPSITDLEIARLFYVLSWQGRGNNSATARIKAGWRFMTKENDHVVQFRDMDKIYSVAWRFKNVTIERDDAIAVCKRFDSLDTLHYLDPPYAHSSSERTVTTGYASEFNELQHRDFIDRARKLKGYVIISGYKSALYTDLLGDWERKESIELDDMLNEKTECLWLSPSVSGVQSRLEGF